VKSGLPAGPSHLLSRIHMLLFHSKSVDATSKKIHFFLFFFFIHVGCPDQLTRTTTIPHGPLDILQAQEQVRHRGVTGVHIEGRTREGSGTSSRWTTAARPSSAEYTRELEPGHSGRQNLPRPLSYKPVCQKIHFIKIMFSLSLDWIVQLSLSLSTFY